MMTRRLVAGLALAACSFVPFASRAAPALRVQVEQTGDFVLIGNTLGYECAAGTPAPVVGTVGACGSNTADSAADVLWRSDSPDLGQAEASSAITVAQARSTAVLALPAGAQVTHAFLYWGATLDVAGADTQVILDRPGESGFVQDVAAIASWQSANNAYQSVADVTALVQAHGAGAYRVSGVDAQNVVDLNNSNNFAGWWMVVLYSRPVDPLRNLAILDGLDVVSYGNNQIASLSGFLVPVGGGAAGKLGVVAFEGDNALTGDQLFFNGGAALSDAQNPANNFFNGTRSNLGSAVSVAGDLPQLTGTAQSMAGLDIDVVDLTAKLDAGQTSATIRATSTNETYFLAGFVTSVNTFRPNLSGASTLTAVDVNGGLLLPGEFLLYTATVANTGNDTAIDTHLTIPIPAGATYVPGSLVVMGAAKTDAAGDDQAEYDAGARQVVFRLGAGATSSLGGDLAANGSSTVTFQVRVNAGMVGLLATQGVAGAAGLMGAPARDSSTDGDPAVVGQQPTAILVDACVDDTLCGGSTPRCAVDPTPNQCVQCLADADCNGFPLLRACQVAAGVCICVPTGAERCDGYDNDCNGQIDEGFGLGTACSAGVGVCQASGTTVCAGDGSGAVCDAVPGAPASEVCGNDVDEDCDGAAAACPPAPPAAGSGGCGCGSGGGGGTSLLLVLLGWLVFAGRLRRVARRTGGV